MSIQDPKYKEMAIQSIDKQVSTQEFREQMERADNLAKVLVKHVCNDEGEVLAHVEENPGFQEIFDYKGGQKRQQRLERKREEVAWNYNARTQLFQKTYYQTGLTMEEEGQLRQAYHSADQSFEWRFQALKWTHFGLFFPIVYQVSRQVRPKTTLLFSFAYSAAIVPFLMANKNMFQSQLNAAAEPIAAKYSLNKYQF